VLSDLNRHLIECYRFVRDDYITVASYLRLHARENVREYYLRIRDVYNRSGVSAAQAARFIYLNRTCFNGVFRVNRQGTFNVPFGDKPSPRFPTVEELASVSAALKKARLRVCDYELAIRSAKKGHFVYLDPPYPPLNGTSFFTHYTKDRFGQADQERLARVVKDLDRRGCLVMVTNADTLFVRSLYSGLNLLELSATRYVTCRAVKHRVGELVITNYDLSVAPLALSFK